ncbi:hypothetical protein [Sinorhizobium meliloti]|uniref:hypothetical protein n=1 Tax=Rhizobium meliloti TaxID=382 RepID=UPI000B49FF9C|nr:hypothetical protein [Sinorhizobium meliloti]ARS65983.1 hypothetical protein SMRU11_00665 [Sinorhizobium meliloti RU11/001]
MRAVFEGERLMPQMAGPFEHVLKQVLVQRLQMGRIECRLGAAPLVQLDQTLCELGMLQLLKLVVGGGSEFVFEGKAICERERH